MGIIDVLMPSVETELIGNLMMLNYTCTKTALLGGIGMTSHGEIEPTEYANVGSSNQQNLYDNMAPTSPTDFDNTNSFVDRVGAMVNDVIVTNEFEVSEQPNAKA